MVDGEVHFIAESVAQGIVAVELGRSGVRPRERVGVYRAHRGRADELDGREGAMVADSLTVDD